MSQSTPYTFKFNYVDATGAEFLKQDTVHSDTRENAVLKLTQKYALNDQFITQFINDGSKVGLADSLIRDTDPAEYLLDPGQLNYVFIKAGPAKVHIDLSDNELGIAVYPVNDSGDSEPIKKMYMPLSDLVV